MEREYIRGNKEHWKEVYKYIYGVEPKIKNSDYTTCGDESTVFVKNEFGGFVYYKGGFIYDAITTNPNWHEVKPWEDNWKPKPFDKVLGWNNDFPSEIHPDIFLYKRYIDGETIYVCANRYWDHVKPYGDE